MEGRQPYVAVNHSPPCWHVHWMGFNAGITCLQDPDHTDRSDLSLLVKSRMGKSNFRFVDKGIGVRKLETAPVSWIWPPCLHRARGILPRQCFRRRWIYCSLTENAEQVGNCAAQRQTEGEKHKLGKTRIACFSRGLHYSGYPKNALCSFTCSSLCFLTVRGNCVLIFQKGLCRLSHQYLWNTHVKLTKNRSVPKKLKWGKFWLIFLPQGWYQAFRYVTDAE